MTLKNYFPIAFDLNFYVTSKSSEFTRNKLLLFFIKNLSSENRVYSLGVDSNFNSKNYKNDNYEMTFRTFLPEKF